MIEKTQTEPQQNIIFVFFQPVSFAAVYRSGGTDRPRALQFLSRTIAAPATPPDQPTHASSV